MAARRNLIMLAICSMLIAGAVHRSEAGFVPFGVDTSGAIPGRMIVMLRQGAFNGSLDGPVPLSALGLPTNTANAFSGIGTTLVEPLSEEVGAAELSSLTTEQATAYAVVRSQFRMYFNLDLSPVVVCEMVAADSNVIMAQPEYMGTEAAEPTDPRFGEQWSLAPGQQGNVSMSGGWDITTGVAAVKVGLIDSGFDTSHGEIAAPNKYILGWDYIGGDATPEDQRYHGTAVGGVIGALTSNRRSGAPYGIAGVAGGWGYDDQTGMGNPGATLSIVKVIDSSGGFENSSLALAILKVASPNIWGPASGCQVINFSGRSSERHFDVVNNLRYAASLDRVFVAAVGNDNSGAPWYPAHLDESWVIAVGACDNVGNRSIWGPHSGSNYGNHIDVVAPGTAILSTSPLVSTTFMQTNGIAPEFASVSGTSFAAPIVTGEAALLRSADPTLRACDVQGIIKVSCDDVGLTGYDDETGWGRVNIGRALSLTQSPWIRTDYSVLGGTDVLTTAPYLAVILADRFDLAGNYTVRRHEVRRTVAVPAHGGTQVFAWGRSMGSESSGWAFGGIFLDTPYCEAMWRAPSEPTITLRSNVYEVWAVGGGFLGWYPCSPSQVRFAYTVLSTPPPPPPMTAYCFGPSGKYCDQSVEFTAAVMNGTGTGPVTYDWRTRTGTGTFGGIVWTGATFSTTMPHDDLEVQVTATRGAEVAASTCDVDYLGCGTGGGGGGGQDDCLNTKCPDIQEAISDPGKGNLQLRLLLGRGDLVSIGLYDIVGRRVTSLYNGWMGAGRHQLTVASGKPKPGMYFVQASIGPESRTRRVVILR